MKERNRGNILGCDKFHHRERSIYHQPNHLKHKPIRIERVPEKRKKHIRKSGK